MQPLTWRREEVSRTDGLRQMAAPPEWASKGQTGSRKAAGWTVLDSELFARSLGSVGAERVAQENQPLRRALAQLCSRSARQG